jgi:hypothetical protein
MENAEMVQDKDFHLYLLIGQSNMAGRGEVGSQDKEVHPRVFTLDREREWVPAADPVHFDKPIAGVGPGLTFGKTMADRDPSVRIGLIPCAAGGSPITVWKHGGYWEQTKSKPYDDAIERAKIAMKHGVLKGILWHQGESDSNENDAQLYEDRLVALVNTLRTDLGIPEAPFIAATLGDFVVENRPEARIINSALRQIPQRVKHTACVDSTGLEHKGDNVHFSAEAARELGRRYAEAMWEKRLPKVAKSGIVSDIGDRCVR